MQATLFTMEGPHHRPGGVEGRVRGPAERAPAGDAHAGRLGPGARGPPYWHSNHLEHGSAVWTKMILAWQRAAT
ncbi:hypothetical protein TRIATDRAFT_297157 [Trichoderma atroviride IMI 206040]|uniref:Uncharacterized protein n=1 Tax=Hypocrea atroviridis (strain ATCC 20476 / IMI 206040) TaxID=452589 RepID=G9NG99_HYPAI|nr:uncharacterized protein TRIATDRAFT_297157 [Trichoderma atroviride IMI 206040]EHK50311.1 hypothetical protein TRIATDRAFT_297157 [Trichoderma atroviride IMI 206040]